MTISAEQIARVHAIIQELDDHLHNPESENRRKKDRVAIRLSMRVILISSTTPIPMDVYSRNISNSGIGFMTRRLFQPEERIAIILRIPKLTPKLILARTTFGRYVGGGMYEVGAEFLEAISDPTGQARVPIAWILAATGKNRPAFEDSDLDDSDPPHQAPREPASPAPVSAEGTAEGGPPSGKAPPSAADREPKRKDKKNKEKSPAPVKS